METIEQFFGKLKKALQELRYDDFIKLLVNKDWQDYANIIDGQINENYKEYIKYYLKGIEKEPDNPDLFNTLFEIYWNSDNWEGMFALETKIPNVPEARAAWWGLAQAYFETGKYEKLYSIVKKAAKFDKKHERPYTYPHVYEGTVLFPKPIKKIKIGSYYSLDKIELENLSDKKEIYFLGENGVGKTLLLQAITIALKGMRNKKLSSSVYLEGVDEEVEFSYINTFAYGVGRLRVSDFDADTTGYGTLFDQQKVNLSNPIAWLKEVERLNIKKISKLKLKTVLDLLNDVLNINSEEASDKNISISSNDKTGEIVFTEQNTIVEFHQLADGFRSILIVLSDLLKRLIENQPDVTNIQNYKGVVLIDEVDMLLHPKWEYSIVKKLRQKFPLIQWFFTTHSPMLILGASEDAVFYRLYKQNSKTKISEQWTNNDISHLMANGLITSPLFNMPTARMKSLKDRAKMDTNPDYLTGKIHEAINKEIEKEKKKGKEYFSKKEIDDLVTWAINEINGEDKE